MSTDEEQLGPPIKPKSGVETDFPKSVTLDDGTEVPVGVPPGMDPEHAALALEYLKSNPVLAQQALQRADKLLRHPQMAQELGQMQEKMLENKEYQERMKLLREDPELKSVFEEISSEGMPAIDKYWNNMELMSKISKKMGELDINKNPEKKKVQTARIRDLHTAAKVDDLQALEKLLKKNHDINDQDARGITPLGVAVGFNKISSVKYLLDNGADPNLFDKQGNTVLHYAAGYGRLECAEMLLNAGVDPQVVNKNQQTPLDVAKINREVSLIDFLTKHLQSTTTQESS